MHDNSTAFLDLGEMAVVTLARPPLGTAGAAIQLAVHDGGQPGDDDLTISAPELHILSVHLVRYPVYSKPSPYCVHSLSAL